MIGEQAVSEILAQYKEHGWNLRRVLLSAEMRAKLPSSIFGEAEIVASDINALWFSRPSRGDCETWELRHLSAAPFALVEVFEPEDEEAVRDEIRGEMETQLKERASNVGNRGADH